MKLVGNQSHAGTGSCPQGQQCWGKKFSRDAGWAQTCLPGGRISENIVEVGRRSENVHVQCINIQFEFKMPQ